MAPRHSNLAAGWGDALSFGITDRIRRWLGVDRIVDKGSGFYIAGEIIGTVHQSALGGIKPTVSKPPCFPAGTLVLTPAGERPIEEVRVGELVLSADPQTGKQSYQRVVGRFIGEAERLLEIETEDGRRVEATEEHPFWVVGQGFVEARGLGLGDLLVDERGRFRAIVGIKQRTGRLLVYNLEVEGTHTYYANGWWVHNRCGPSIRKVIKTRPNPGRDGGTSRHIIEKVGDETISVTHQVEVDGRIIHQHQTHIGQHGTMRRFPDEWIEYKDIP